MSSAMERHRSRVDSLVSEPMEGEEHFDIFSGAASDDIMKYLPLAAGAVSEITATELKKKEAREAEAKLKNSEAYKAEAAAQEARKKAEMAKAEAITEADPNGPKHRVAAELNLAALAAEQKAMFFKQQAAMSSASAGVPMGPMPTPSSGLNTKHLLIGGGVVLGLAMFALILKKK